MMDDHTFMIGYEEDGVMRVAGVPDSSAAELAMKDWSGDWRVVAEIYVRFVENTDGKHEVWEECTRYTPNAERAWRVVDVSRPEIVLLNDYDEEELQPNPYFEPERPTASD